LIEYGQTDDFVRGNMLEANAMDGVASTGIPLLEGRAGHFA